MKFSDICEKDGEMFRHKNSIYNHKKNFHSGEIQKYFGGEALTWNVIQHIYDDIDEEKFTFLEPIKDKSKIYDNHKKIFTILSNVHKAGATKNTVKEELEKGAKQCELFGKLYPVLFPKETISRKQHVLIVVLPKFLRQGIMYRFLKVEQKGENLHCTFNRLETQLEHVKNKSDRFFQMIKAHENEMKTSRNFFEKNNKTMKKK